MARVLIVDDEPRNRDLIREHLQYAGFTCAEAGDGTQALAELANGGIDLVILDIMMPFMDGMTCLREMRTRKIMTPVIMLTARSEEYDKLAGLEGGETRYLTAEDGSVLQCQDFDAQEAAQYSQAVREILGDAPLDQGEEISLRSEVYTQESWVKAMVIFEDAPTPLS